MLVSIIVAFDENQLIGSGNKLPWHLPADLKYFKSITMGHSMIMGRKTFESIGKALPGRRSIVVSRQAGLELPECEVTSTFDQALAACHGEDEVFIIGGAEIFRHALPHADKLYITQIHHVFQGEVYFPPVTKSEWNEIARMDFDADEKNPWPYSFIQYVRK